LSHYSESVNSTIIFSIPVDFIDFIDTCIVIPNLIKIKDRKKEKRKKDRFIMWCIQLNLQYEINNIIYYNNPD